MSLCHKCEQNEAATSFAGQPVCGDCFDILKRTNPSKLVAFLASTQNGNGELLTVAQAARRLSISSRTLYRLIQRGEIDAKHFGNTTRLEPEALTKYLDRQGSRLGLFG